MSILARMKTYPVKRRARRQGSLGQIVDGWTDDGAITGTFHNTPPENLEAQGMRHREHESFLVTLQRGKVTKGTHRIVINGELYDVLDVDETNNRFVRIVVKSAQEAIS